MDYAFVKGILLEISVQNVIQGSLMLIVKVLVLKDLNFFWCVFINIRINYFVEFTKILLTTGHYLTFTDLISTLLIDLDGTCNVDLPNYPKALRGATGNFANDMILICGGKMVKYGYINECYKLSKGGKSFDTFQAMSENRGWASSAVINDQNIWITGGKNENSTHGTTEFINSSTIFCGVNLPEPIDHHIIISLNSTTSFLIGGFIDDVSSDKTYYFNHENNIWIEGPYLNGPRAMHTAGVIKDHITHLEHVVVAGGSIDGLVNNLNSVEILFNNQNYWSKGTYKGLIVICTSTMKIGIIKDLVHT